MYHGRCFHPPQVSEPEAPILPAGLYQHHEAVVKNPSCELAYDIVTVRLHRRHWMWRRTPWSRGSSKPSARSWWMRASTSCPAPSPSPVPRTAVSGSPSGPSCVIGWHHGRWALISKFFLEKLDGDPVAPVSFGSIGALNSAYASCRQRGIRYCAQWAELCDWLASWQVGNPSSSGAIGLCLFLKYLCPFAPLYLAFFSLPTWAFTFPFFSLLSYQATLKGFVPSRWSAKTMILVQRSCCEFNCSHFFVFRLRFQNTTCSCV